MVSVRDVLALWDIALRLPLQFDRDRLTADLDAMDPAWWSVHRGPYHDGKWEMIALRAPNGDQHNQTSRGGAFADTEAAARCRYLHEVLSAFPAEWNRVRYLRLRAGGHILRHSDPMRDIDPRLIRIHVPVRTNPAVEFRVDDRLVTMREGDSWFVDVRFPHEVINRGDSDRVHLVIDLLRNEAVDAIAARGDSIGRARLSGYMLKQSLPGRVRRWAGIGN
jgi:hypothetical protein